MFLRREHGGRQEVACRHGAQSQAEWVLDKTAMQLTEMWKESSRDLGLSIVAERNSEAGGFRGRIEAKLIKIDLVTGARDCQLRRSCGNLYTRARLVK
jgi:hypothetical protein